MKSGTATLKRNYRTKGFWKSKQNRRQQLDALAKKFNIQTQQDWFRVPTIKIAKESGGMLSSKNFTTVRSLLQSTYPEFLWHPWNFATKNHWSLPHRQKEFFDWFAEENHITRFEDWFRISGEEVKEQGGGAILNVYGGYFISALQGIYPQYQWYPWVFSVHLTSLWTDLSALRSYFDWIADETGIQKQEEWYQLQPSILLERNGRNILERYNDSHIDALEAAYPEYLWYPWLSEVCVRRTWNDQKNLRKLFDWLAEDKFVIETQEDWYAISHSDLHNCTFGSLVTFEGSYIKALQTAYPEFSWAVYRFPHVSVGFWQDPVNQRNFLDWMGERLGCETQEDWYRVKYHQLIQNGGRALLHYHKFSFIRAVTSIYTEHEWHPWQFDTCPRGWWNNPQNVQRFIRWFEEQNGIETVEDWYKVPRDELVRMGGISLFKNKLKMVELLQKLFPDHDWDDERIHRKGKVQHTLLNVLQSTFHSSKIVDSKSVLSTNK